MMPEEFRALKRAVVNHLRGRAVGAGQSIEELRLVIPHASLAEIERALDGLRRDGLVSYAESLGPGGVTEIELTAAGLGHDLTENAAPRSSTVTVYGGNVQVGNHNRQDMSVVPGRGGR